MDDTQQPRSIRADNRLLGILTRTLQLLAETKGALIQSGLVTMGDIVLKSREEIHAIVGTEKKTKAVEKAVKDQGLALSMVIEKVTPPAPPEPPIPPPAPPALAAESRTPFRSQRPLASSFRREGKPFPMTLSEAPVGEDPRPSTPIETALSDELNYLFERAPTNFKAGTIPSIVKQELIRAFERGQAILQGETPAKITVPKNAIDIDDRVRQLLMAEFDKVGAPVTNVIPDTVKASITNILRASRTYTAEPR